MSRKAKIKNYFEGMREGVKLYAHWKDGVQYVGTCGRTLKEAFADIDKMEQDMIDALEENRTVYSELGYSRVGRDAMRRG